MQTAVSTELPNNVIMSHEVRGHAGVLTLSAADLCEQDVKAVAGQVLQLARKSEGRLVLDVGMVSPLHCLWINTLLGLHRSCRNMGGQLVVAGLSREARQVMAATGLTRTLMVVQSREEGVRALDRADTRPGLVARLFGKAA